MTEVNRIRACKAKVVASAAALLASFSMQVANAGDSQSAFVMTVIADEAQGDKMIAGNYAEAIAAITSLAVRQNGFAASNNLCVAYTKTNELGRAEQACAQALRASRTMSGPSYDAYRKRSDQAVALSNRGVIRAITGDREGARSDFEQARKLNDGLKAVAANLARLDNEATQTVSSL